MNIEKYYTSKDYNLGYEYHHGVGVEKNEKLAFECYQKAADNYDHLLAIFSLGHCYQHGIGVTVNHEMAFEFYKKTFDKGLPEGTYMVGYCYSHGIGVVNNTQESHRFFQMAASHGVTGPFDVGRCFKPDSRRIFTKEKNLELASRYHDSANYIEMFKYFQKSAEMGNAFGTFNVGYSYAKGIGVEKDEHKAFIYYQKSAEMGHANGTYHVGCFYNDGIGVEKDE
ncbi:HCP-like protein [Gigaspora margarita]|uniref:HCP-like protein n=1 Tax=Gigaspora margarita TaxID=4874 RepID=A0A8H4A0E7_GIGMA|nr:HCP-like protein [Gigaspora margarita]